MQLISQDEDDDDDDDDNNNNNLPYVPLEACMPTVNYYCSITTHENSQMPVSEDNVQPSQYCKSDIVSQTHQMPSSFLMRIAIQ